MIKQFASDEINSKIQNPFVFISYSQTDKTGKEVKTLFNYLDHKGINVIYDNGGLGLGEQLQQFQQLIIHPNCYKVLIVFDDTYVAKVEDNTQITGVSTEYKYIANSYYKNQSKFIPIKFRASVKLPVLFDGSSIYSKMYESSERQKILDECTIKKKKTHQNLVDAQKNISEAERLYEEKDYNAAKKKAEKIILSEIKSPDEKEIDKVIAHAYSLLLCISERTNSQDEVTRKSLQGLTYMLQNKRVEPDNLPNYYMNCSQVYMKLDEDEQCRLMATSAYDVAKTSKFSNLFYYECHLAYIYYKYEQYSDAYKFIQSAYNHYKKEPSKELKQEHIHTFQKICTNYCEIAVKKDKNENDINKKKEYLDKTKSVISDLLNMLKKKDWSSIEYKEIYEAMSIVHTEYAKYYGGMVKES